MAASPDVGKYVSASIETYKNDLVTWIIVGLIGSIAIGVGFWGGFQYCALKAARGEKVEYADVIYPFKRFVDFFVPSVIIFVGFMLCFVPGLLLATWWYYAYPIMIEENVGWSEATKRSKEIAGAALVPTLIVMIVGGFLSNLLNAIGLGFITAPFHGLIQVNAYRHVIKGET